jgi:hypothetical protein
MKRNPKPNREALQGGIQSSSKLDCHVKEGSTQSHEDSVRLKGSSTSECNCLQSESKGLEIIEKQVVKTQD